MRMNDELEIWNVEFGMKELGIRNESEGGWGVVKTRVGERLS